jgi:hypothetical protein
LKAAGATPGARPPQASVPEGAPAPEASGTAPPPSGEECIAPPNAEEEFQKLFAALEPSYLEAARTDGQPGADANELLRRLNFIWSNVNDYMGSGDFAAALKALRPLEDGKLFAEIRAAKGLGGGPIAEGTVEKRKFLITRFQQIPAELRAELAKLRAEIEKNHPDEDAAELTDAMEENLNSIVEGLQGEIDDAITAGDMSLIKGLKARVTSDELIAHLLANPFVNGTKFQSALTDALDEIEAKLVA